MWVEPVRLEGRLVTLEPLGKQHVEALRAAADSEVWRWLSVDFEAWLEDALTQREEIVFAVVRAGIAVGSTRYLSIAPEHRRLEIGWTWFAREAWGTGANVEAKLLMLRHAFETLGCRRVEFKTDARNERSRAALEALPAQFEGVHRKHMLVRGGERRDSAWYSVVDDEWPAVEANLLRRLASGAR